MFNKKIFGSNVKLLRLEKQLTQKQLADELGVCKSIISEIENGKHTTTLEKVYILSEYFNVSIDFLVGKSDIRK